MTRRFAYLCSAMLMLFLGVAVFAMELPSEGGSHPAVASGLSQKVSVASRSSRKTQASQTPAAPAAAADYVGEDTCLACHEDRSYRGTLHALAFNARTPAANHGCESCHGPGKAHAESGDPALIRR